jgi:hypothetical protein
MGLLVFINFVASAPRCKADQKQGWEALAYDSSMILFFSHVPSTGGTALSWHLRATAVRARMLVAPGSQESSLFIPGQNDFADFPLEDSRADAERWGKGTRSKDGIKPLYALAFGHNEFDDPHVASWSAPLRFLTMLRSPREFALANNGAWICNELKMRYHKNAKGLSWMSGEWTANAPAPVARYCSKFGDTRGSGNYVYEDMLTQALRKEPMNPAHRGGAFKPSGFDEDVASALKTLHDMPWFGIKEHWGGSLCLLHYATGFGWPHESLQACGPSIQVIPNHANMTSGSAKNDSPPQWEEVQHFHNAINGHKGQGPDIGNSWSVCPIRIAEAVLARSSATKLFSEWALEHAPALVEKIFPEKLTRAMSPFDSHAPDPRGKDATVYAWGLSVFERRMQHASEDLSLRGYSFTNVPEFLSPDCFSHFSPNGFAIPV